MEIVIPDLLPVLRKNRNLVTAINDPVGQVGFLAMNHLYPPFNDVQPRRAILMALSQEDYMRAVVGDDDSLWKPCRAISRLARRFTPTMATSSKVRANWMPPNDCSARAAMRASPLP
jgi:ABC-type transport system substrate-binding protein